MDRTEYIAKKKSEIVSIANAVLQKKLEIIPACRILCQLILEAELEEDEFTQAIKAIESETDDIPYGSVRKRYDPSYLEQIDAEAKEYITRVEDVMAQACASLIKKCSP